LPDGVPTLASALRDAGYTTGSINENGAISRKLGFDRGFDYYVEKRSAVINRPEGHVAALFESGRRFIERHRHERWFLFLHTYEVHYPYTPPPKYASFFREGDDPMHPDNQRIGGGRDEYRPVQYDREIRHVDTELKKLIEGLDAGGLLDDTLVVVTSDHGEAFLEHTFLGHGSDVHQESVHIPLILLGPEIAAGRRIAAPVGLIDLMPSLLDWLGIPPPEGMMGRSFVPLLRGADDTSEWQQRTIVTEAWHPWGTTRKGRVDILPPALAVRRGSLKLIRHKTPRGPRYALYDLDHDPGERTNLFDPADRRSIELQQIADAYEAGSATVVEQLGLPPLMSGDAEAGEVDPERLEALRALGYVE
jgi:arylsulfatase A-like enzyme